MPFAVLLGVAVAASPRPELRIGFSLEAARMLEGGTIGGQLDVQADGPAEWVELELVRPGGAHAWSETPAGRHFGSRAGASRRFDYELDCERWGAYRIGLVDVRDPERVRAVVDDGADRCRLPLRAYPRRERLLRVVQAHDTTPFSGSQVSRAKGEGIEFADIRPFAPGDRVRRVNWRASARRERMYVNESHPERASDVILFLDSFAEARGPGEGTIDQAVRAAVLARRRVPGAPEPRRARQLRRHPPLASPRDGHAPAVPHRRGSDRDRAGALVSLDDGRRDSEARPPAAGARVALTPLLDQRTISALLDLRARGFDLAVVDVSPIPYAADAARHRRRPGLAALDDVAAGACITGTSGSAFRWSSGRPSDRCSAPSRR